MRAHWLLVGAVVTCTLYIFFFMLQRTALELCRAQGVPDHRRFVLLPIWYRVLAWPTTVVRMALLLATAYWYSWVWALVVWAAEWLVTLTAPIPHGALLRILRPRGAARTSLQHHPATPDAEQYPSLTTRSKVGIGLGAIAAGYLPFMAIRLLVDGLFLTESGPTLPWALGSFAAQSAGAFSAVWFGRLAAPSPRRAEVATVIAAPVGLFGLLGAAGALVFGSSLGRLIPAVGALCSFIGAASAAYLAQPSPRGPRERAEER